MTPDQIFQDFEAGFARRRYTAGLLIAFIDFYTALGVPALQLKNLNEVLGKFPRQTLTGSGDQANTLIVSLGGATLSLRPFYNAAEHFFRAEQMRFDYPSCAPHATQAWTSYERWLDALATYDAAQLADVRKRVTDFVLTTFKSHAFDPSSVRIEPRLFQLLLEDFQLTAQKGEPTGAAFQGVVFGFLRADNPHLQIEIDKVRTGSKRLQRVGDIDGWDGARLAISAEVKQFQLQPDDVPALEAFANATGQRGALGIIAALSFKDSAREQLEDMGLRPIDRQEMRRIVELWDPLKQRTAAASLVYYARHVEKNSSLADRIDTFLLDAAQQPGAPR